MPCIEVDRATWESHGASHRCLVKNETPTVDEALVAEDWQMYRFYEGAVNTGYVEDLYMLSTKLNMKRPLTVGEWYGRHN